MFNKRFKYLRRRFIIKIVYVLPLFFLFSCWNAYKIESKAPPEYKDIPIKFIYVHIRDHGQGFSIRKIEYCYKFQEYIDSNHMFISKTLQMEIYDENNKFLDTLPLKKRSNDLTNSFFILKIPYRKNIKSFKIFRLDEKGIALPERYTMSDFPKRHEEELEDCEYEEEEDKESCRNKEIHNEPFKKRVYNNHKTLDYDEATKCHNKHYLLLR